MLIYLLSEELCLFSGLCYVRPYLLYVFPVVLFIIPGGWIKVIILLYCVTLAYDIIKLVVVRLIWYLHSALLSSLYFGNHLSETINDYTLHLFSSETWSVGETRGNTPPLLHLPLLLQSSYNGSWEFWILGMFKQACSHSRLLNAFQVLFKVKQIFKHTTQSSIPRLDSYEWQDVWDSMDKNLGEWTPPMFWNFTPKKVQNPEN